MSYLVLIALAAAVFYVLIPGIGAFAVRARWRRFRSAMIQASRHQQVHYGVIHGITDRSRPTGEGLFGTFRMLGRLEATEGDELIWVSTKETSVAADLTDVSIFVLPPGGLVSHSFPDQTPRVFTWPQLAAVPEGTRIFVAGPLFWEDQRPVFRSTEDIPVTVVVYDCDEVELLPRAIWTGRQRNEYWNELTPIALTAGFLAELILSILSADTAPTSSLVALVLAFTPILPIFPPGVVAYYGYRRLWRHARKLRAYRDLARLALRFLEDQDQPARTGQPMPLPDGGEYAVTNANNVQPPDQMLVVPSPDEHTDGQGQMVYYPDYSRDDQALRDPMVGPVLVPDDPLRLADVFQRRARRWEYTALVLFLLGMLANQYLVALALAALL